jgi:hypothetical protein
MFSGLENLTDSIAHPSIWADVASGIAIAVVFHVFVFRLKRRILCLERNILVLKSGYLEIARLIDPDFEFLKPWNDAILSGVIRKLSRDSNENQGPHVH